MHESGIKKYTDMASQKSRYYTTFWCVETPERVNRVQQSAGKRRGKEIEFVTDRTPDTLSKCWLLPYSFISADGVLHTFSRLFVRTSGFPMKNDSHDFDFSFQPH